MKEAALSAWLLQHSPSDPRLTDQVCILGEVSKKDSLWRVDIKHDTPSAVFKDELRPILGEVPTVNEVREGFPGVHLSLISAGTFPWINGKLAVFRRDATAKVDAGLLTSPAGRCGEKPSKTVLKETNEELFIIIEKAGVPNLIVFGDASDTSLVQTRLIQCQKMSARYKEKGLTEEAELLSKISESSLVFASPQKVDSKEGESVAVFVDEKEMDRLDHAFVYFDEEKHTFEIRVPIVLPDVQILALLDGESFMRETTLLSIEELKKEKCVITLAKYIETL